MTIGKKRYLEKAIRQRIKDFPSEYWSQTIDDVSFDPNHMRYIDSDTIGISMPLGQYIDLVKHTLQK